MDTRPEQFLGRTDLPGSRMKESVQLSHIRGSAVGQAAVRLVPDVLGRIEFRGVGREVLRVDPRMLLQEAADLFAAVDGALIPEEKHRTPKVSHQMLLLGSDRQGADGRNRALFVPVPSIGCPPFLRPGSLKVRDE